jgi:hypothetical protein
MATEERKVLCSDANETLDNYYRYFILPVCPADAGSGDANPGRENEDGLPGSAGGLF